jgi:hypothetical protein
VPLTPLQSDILACVAPHRSPDSHLAGGAAIHFAPDSQRYSADLDFFHDSAERVAQAFAADDATLRTAGFDVHVELSQPGFLRALVSRDSESTRVDWAHDTAWRFLPPVQDTLGGYLLHPIDLAINKTLALAGRDEPRDFVDILYVHAHVLPVPALVWAACGKDPGFSPLSLLDLLRRRGRYHARDFARLHLTKPVDLVVAKAAWLAILETTEAFARARPVEELGCLYWHAARKVFVVPSEDEPVGPPGDLRLHFGRPGGVLPLPAGLELES